MSKVMRKHTFPKVYIEIEVRDRNGNIIEKRKEPSRTWVQNFMNLLWGIFSGAPFQVTLPNASTNTVNISRCCDAYLTVNAGQNDDSFGIVVGSGTTAYSVSQYTLSQQIQNGTGNGQLLYGSTTVNTVVDTGSSLVIQIVRTFTNDSGSSVSVNEIGLMISVGQSCANWKFLIARDVLSSGVTVPNGSTLTVRYIVTMTYA